MVKWTRPGASDTALTLVTSCPRRTRVTASGGNPTSATVPLVACVLWSVHGVACQGCCEGPDTLQSVPHEGRPLRADSG